MLFKNPVRTSKRTPHFTITKINWLTLFKEIIAVHSENLMKSTHTLCGKDAELLIVKADGVSFLLPLAALDGLVVSVLEIGPKIPGFKSCRGRRAIK
jgi:hypothetical protein